MAHIEYLGYANIAVLFYVVARLEIVNYKVNELVKDFNNVYFKYIKQNAQQAPANVGSK